MTVAVTVRRGSGTTKPIVSASCVIHCEPKRLRNNNNRIIKITSAWKGPKSEGKYTQKTWIYCNLNPLPFFFILLHHWMSSYEVKQQTTVLWFKGKLASFFIVCFQICIHFFPLSAKLCGLDLAVAAFVTQDSKGY